MRAPTRRERERWLARLGDRAAHDEIASGLACLREVDAEQPLSPHTTSGWLRVAVWNLERGRRPRLAARLLERTGAHVCLLSEADDGVARTGNRHVTRSIARRLGAGFAFGVEFVELGLGSGADGDVRGTNARGLHGNAVLSRAPFRDAAVVRLDAGGDWFTAARGEPRVGGRVAVVATVDLDGVPITVASVHLESHSDPDHRAAQMHALLRAIDPGGAAVIGGDLNTFGATLAAHADRRGIAAMRAAEPARFSWPVAHEPLFGIARDHSFEWVDCNVAAPTTRHGPGGLPAHHPMKLDWILVRGLEAGRPTVVPAAAPDGSSLSDHEAIAVSVRLRR